MASARLEAMMAEIAATRAAMQGALPLVRNYGNLKAAADELEKMDELMKGLATDRAALASAVGTTAAPVETTL